jgi:hypothetical protein
MNLQKTLNLEKIKELLADFFQRQSYWCLLILNLLLSVYTAYLFISYVFKNPPPTQQGSNLQIKTELYQDVILRLKQRDANIQQGIGQGYPDVFR